MPTPTSYLPLLGLLGALALLGLGGAAALLPGARRIEQPLLLVTLLAAAAATFAAALARRRRAPPNRRRLPRSSLAERATLLPGVLALAAALLAAWALPIWQWDAAGYHLPFANFLIQAGALSGVPADVPYLSSCPHATELAFAGLRAFLPDDRPLLACRTNPCTVYRILPERGGVEAPA